MQPRLSSIGVPALIAFPAATWAQPCTPQWSTEFVPTDLTPSGGSPVLFDEGGPGPGEPVMDLSGGDYDHIARWGCPQAPERTPCDPDCDNDGILTLADFGCFINNFARLTPYADVTADGQWNVADFGLFQTRFRPRLPMMQRRNPPGGGSRCRASLDSAAQAPSGLRLEYGE
jgi:hypothetical protein